MKEDEAPKSTVLEVILDGHIQRVFARSVIGMRLSCFVANRGGGGEQLISDSQACDKKQFWALWKALGGQAMWEDGTVFEPTYPFF